jgi:hypothetical protein
MDASFLELFKESRSLYSGYKDAKSAYSGEPDKEEALIGALAPFLRSLLEIGREFWANSECGAERDLMRRFVLELERIFK